MLAPAPDPTSIYSLLYVSLSRIPLPAHLGEVGALVHAAQRRNTELAVTGALIFTGRHFAQLLEGPAPAVGQLMASIDRDSRHEQVTVIETMQRETRRFPSWSLAYWGYASFFDGLVATLHGKRDAGARPARPIALLHTAMQQFVVQGGGHPIGQRPIR